MLKRHGALMAVAFLEVLLVGCVETNPLPTPNQATGTSLEVIGAHVDSAEKANQQIPAHADPAGKALSGVVTSEHKAADAELVKARAENAAQATQIASLTKAVSVNLKRAQADEATIGYRAEVWIKRFAFLVGTLFALHYILLAAGVVCAVFPQTLVAVPILKLIGSILNPLAWGQAIADHLHLTWGLCPEIKITQV